MNTLAEAVIGKVEQLTADVNSIKAKQSTIEAKSTDVIELPNPLRKRA